MRVMCLQDVNLGKSKIFISEAKTLSLLERARAAEVGFCGHALLQSTLITLKQLTT